MSARAPLPPIVAPDSNPRLLDTTIDASLTGPDYVEQIAKLNIHIPATRSWKDGNKWPHESIPQEIMKYNHQITGPMLIRVGLFGEFEMLRFWNDLNAIVEKTWGSWDNMHAARHTRDWDVKEMREALVGQLWSLWEEPAGFPNDPAIKKWFRGFVAYRVKNSRRARKRQRNTSPKPVKKPKSTVSRVKAKGPPSRFHVPNILAWKQRLDVLPAAPAQQAPVQSDASNALAPMGLRNSQTQDPNSTSTAPLARTPIPAQGTAAAQLQPQSNSNLMNSALENLHPLVTMDLIVSWSNEWNGTQLPSSDGPAYTLNLSQLGIATLDNDRFVSPDRAVELIAQALQFAPVNWDPQLEYLVLLDSQSGLHYAIDSLTGMNKGRILEALREERQRNQNCLKIKIVKRCPDRNMDRGREMAVGAGGSHVPEPTNTASLPAPEVQRDSTAKNAQDVRQVESGQLETTIALGLMNIIVSRSSTWNGDGYPPKDHPSYAITPSALGIHGTQNVVDCTEAIVKWLRYGVVQWNVEQELIIVLGSERGKSCAIDRNGTYKILSALLREHKRNEVSLKMKIVPRVYDLGSASEDETTNPGEE